MKVALVHDYLIQDGGAERVLLALHRHFPEAPIFTLFFDDAHLHPELTRANIVPSHLQRWLPHHRLYQFFLPFMPNAIERIDLSEYDVVIASSSSFAKGAIVHPNAKFICYLHTPTRFLWEERTRYLDDLGFSWLSKQPIQSLLHRLRMWDRLAADRPDYLLTNSKTSQKRIKRYYQKEATVLHPPIPLADIPFNPQPGKYWLTGGRLIPYKRFDVSIQAANTLHVPLKIFGIGPDEKRLKKLAGPTVEFLGHISEEEKHTIYQHSLGFLHPHIEDFGITSLESVAHGKPVIALNQGGALETIIPGKTGIFIDQPTPEALANVMRTFDPSAFDPALLREHAARFDTPHFLGEIDRVIATLLTHVSPD